MRLVGYRGLGLVLAFVSTAALAFQEQGGGAPAITTPSPSAPAEGANKAPGAEGNFSAPKAGAGEAVGTEVRIPGLGKLGVLPKMDFGLELLYGANETTSKPADPAEPENGDLTIRGSLKHNF